MQRKNVTSKQSRKGTKKNSIQKKRVPKEKILELALIKSYPNQVVWETWLPGTPVKRTTTVTTGVIATGIAVSSASIQAFATRFGSTFVEYRIIRAKFRIRLFSSTNPGLLQFWLDEKSAGTPTLVEAQERAVLSCSAAAIDTMSELDWTSSDTLDLQYLAIATASTLCTFKEYTNNANFGSSIVATDYYEVIPAFQLQFRGLQGV